jgi:(E)-4-hydroxy-3-methylbut-2-enyl-diphosphate synthase
MFENDKFYCESLTAYKRLVTREVKIGGTPLGGSNPIRIQSMTTTDTMDTIATVEQSIRMIDSGCEYVRITAPSIKEAQNLAEIKKELKKRGYNTPLIADIHFTPNAAELAARIVEKVRVNPGNYADKKKFEHIEYDNNEYEAELDRIRERFTPLVKICKEYGTAMRIGTNHGSLSDRIMSRYGDSPLGMVESALEFLRICEDLNFYDIVLSMKASNPKVMIQAYRLLINKMRAEGMNYPLHLGVTEAGGGEDGRIKSAAGIGALLEDGIGDTVRVSLTEAPEFEAPVAIALVERYKNRIGHKEIPEAKNYPVNPFEYDKRETFELLGIGGNNAPKVFTDFSKVSEISRGTLLPAGYSYDAATDKWKIGDQAADFIYFGTNEPGFELPPGLKPIFDFSRWARLAGNEKSFPLFSLQEYKSVREKSPLFNFISLTIDELTSENIALLKNDRTVIIVAESFNRHAMAELRRLFTELINNEVKNPVVIKRSCEENFDSLMLRASTDFGGLLADGLGDAVWIDSLNTETNLTGGINRLLFGILQAVRARITKTEYIACPSCGRTLFDLLETTEIIKQRTEHLKGVKIAIMGCIVNGPGEMADADYGYVGSGPGKITLYRGKEIIKRAIPSQSALDELINLIKEDGLWIENNKQV